jgi:hypothetical protein
LTGEIVAEDLIILARLFDLLDWLLPKAERFPRPYRATVTQRLMDAALDLQERLFDAQSLRGAKRTSALHAADAALNKLRLYLRLAQHWHWFSAGQHEHVSRMVAEVGRLLGGWLKQTSAATGENVGRGASG